jgi:acyl-[acyl-carrier-protein]-phospholipid O-acyltransferase/long-chain-fatty-acid--[acyl-carrier-protein] ligase
VAQPDKAKMLAAIATGLFILPYFLFSALAGKLPMPSTRHG